MNLRNLEFLVQEAFTGIKRNGLMAFASITTIALTLGVLGAFLLLAMGANNFAAAQINRFEIAVFVKSDTLAGAERIAKAIRDISGVGSVNVRDRDKEWEKVKREQPASTSAGLPAGFRLPFAMDVNVSDPQRLPAIANKIRAMSGIDNVKEGREDFNRLMALAQVVKALSVAGVMVLLVTTVFIISNAIKLTLYARRREIRIMQLVGATNQFIRTPLVIEGIVFGAMGAVTAWLLLVAGTSYLSRAAEKLTFMGQFSSGVQPSQLALGLMILGGAIGATGSFVSIRRFLRD